VMLTAVPIQWPPGYESSYLTIESENQAAGKHSGKSSSGRLGISGHGNKRRHDSLGHWTPTAA
jgi:hypothetical protein